jgi:hypothetical protein
VVALAILAFRSDALPDGLGWAAVVMLGLVAVTTVIGSTTGTPVPTGVREVVVAVALLTGIEVWQAVLAWTLLARVTGVG